MATSRPENRSSDSNAQTKGLTGNDFDARLVITSINSMSGTVGFMVSRRYMNDGPAPGNQQSNDTQQVNLTVGDLDGGSSLTMAEVQVINVAPVISDVVLTDSIHENGLVTITGIVFDPGLLDGHILTIHWGDPNNQLESRFELPSALTVNPLDGSTLPNLFEVENPTFTSITPGDETTVLSLLFQLADPTEDAPQGTFKFTVSRQFLDDGVAPGNVSNFDVSSVVVTVSDLDGGHHMPRG